MACGSRPGARTPETTAATPPPLLSGKAKLWPATRTLPVIRLYCASSSLTVEVGRGQPGVADQRREHLAARDVHGQRRDRQLVAHGAGDLAAEGDRVEPGAQPAGQGDQLADQGLGVAVGALRVVGVCRKVRADEGRDQAEPQAGDRPGERRAALVLVEACRWSGTTTTYAVSSADSDSATPRGPAAAGRR